jgi:GT2 family glycosyltransferase
MIISLVVPSLSGFSVLNQRCRDSWEETASEKIEFILSESDAPFAINANEGIKKAKGDVIAVVNNDTTALPMWNEWLHRAINHGKYVVGFTPDPGMGWGFALSRQGWNEIGLLDENLINSYDDYDLFLRASQRGYSMLLAPRHYAIHQGGVTLEKVWGHRGAQSKTRLAQCHANRQYMLQKWPGIDIDKVPTLYFVAHGKRLMQEWTQKNPSLVSQS